MSAPPPPPIDCLTIIIYIFVVAPEQNQQEYQQTQISVVPATPTSPVTRSATSPVSSLTNHDWENFQILQSKFSHCRQKCLAERQRLESTAHEVKVVVAEILRFHSNPHKENCRKVAKKLVDAYPLTIFWGKLEHG